ncbi:unnamed protein product, partial [Iphiclides podalirius]
MCPRAEGVAASCSYKRRVPGTFISISAECRRARVQHDSSDRYPSPLYRKPVRLVHTQGPAARCSDKIED